MGNHQIQMSQGGDASVSQAFVGQLSSFNNMQNQKTFPSTHMKQFMHPNARAVTNFTGPKRPQNGPLRLGTVVMNSNQGSGNTTNAFNSNQKIIKGGASLFKNNSEIKNMSKISNEEVIQIQKSDVSNKPSQLESITKDMAKNLSAKYLNTEKASTIMDLMEQVQNIRGNSQSNDFLEKLKGQHDQAQAENSVSTGQETSRNQPLVEFINQNMSEDEIEKMIRNHIALQTAEQIQINMNPESETDQVYESQGEITLEKYDEPLIQEQSNEKFVQQFYETFEDVMTEEQKVMKVRVKTFFCNPMNFGKQAKYNYERMIESYVQGSTGEVDAVMKALMFVEEWNKKIDALEGQQKKNEKKDLTLEESIQLEKQKYAEFICKPEVIETMGEQGLQQFRFMMEFMTKDVTDQDELHFSYRKLNRILNENYQTKKYSQYKDKFDVKFESMMGAMQDEIIKNEEHRSNADERINHQDPMVEQLLQQQLERVNQYLDKKEIKSNEQRKQALMNHQKMLIEFKIQDKEEAIRWLYQKDVLLQRWLKSFEDFNTVKSQVENKTQGTKVKIFNGKKNQDNAKTPDATNGQKQEQPSDKEVNTAMHHNQQMGNEMNGFIGPTGHSVKGIIPDGWGSIAQVRVNKSTGKVDHVVRMHTPQDAKFATQYINFLQNQFDDLAKQEKLDYDSAKAISNEEEKTRIFKQLRDKYGRGPSEDTDNGLDNTPTQNENGQEYDSVMQTKNEASSPNKQPEDPIMQSKKIELEEQKARLVNLSIKLQKVQQDKKALLELKEEGQPKCAMEEQLDMIETTLHRYIKRVQHYISEAELQNLASESNSSKKPIKTQVMANGSDEAIKTYNSRSKQPLNGAFVTGNLDHVEELQKYEKSQQDTHMRSVIKKKESDLKHKLHVKQNLRNVMKVADDKRFSSMDEYFKIMIQQYNEFFQNELSGKTNLKSVILEQQKLTRSEKNLIIRLHNEASDSEVYGQELFRYCQQLVQQGKADEGFEDQIYVLSVDWPLDFLVGFIPRDIE